MADDFTWHRPGVIADPIWMEYAVRELEVESETKSQLIATQFEALAAVHTALADGARKASQILGGGGQ